MAKEIPANINHEKFLSKIRVVEKCWEWVGNISRMGYGTLMINTKTYKAHRVSYSIFVEQPRIDMVIDHICRNKKCVNPEHLREVSVSTNNTENSIGMGAINKAKTHCKRGHEFTEENTRCYRGLRSCRKCINMHASNRRVRKPKSDMIYIYKEDIAFRVKFKINGKFLSIGRFKNIEDAKDARDNYLKQKLFGAENGQLF